MLERAAVVCECVTANQEDRALGESSRIEGRSPSKAFLLRVEKSETFRFA